MALNIIAEALVRIEHKLDILVRKLVGTGISERMHFVTNPCPVCEYPVDYLVDINQNVVVRRCGCSTGKLPSVIPLLPVTQKGNTDAPTSGINIVSASNGEER